MPNRFAVWHCYANGKAFGQPWLVQAETPEAIRAECSFRLHIEPVDSDQWEILADRQHEQHQAVMEEFTLQPGTGAQAPPPWAVREQGHGPLGR